MDEIIYRQKNAPEPMTGRRFLLGAAGIVLRLAVAQLAVNALIALSGEGLLNILFYLYAVVLLIAFMRRTVAASVYALGERTLTLQSMLGDSTTAVVELPLDRVIALRPVARCENLRLCYAQVTAVDAQAKPGLRVRAAFFASLLSARLARIVAGKRAQEEAGWAAVFEEDGRLRACVFRPDEEMLRALAIALPDAFDMDDRMARERVDTIYARALARAFPAQYPHVSPLIAEEDMRWARGEIKRQKGEKEKEKRAQQTRKKARAAAKARKKKSKKPDAAPLIEDETNTAPQAPEAVRRRRQSRANEEQETQTDDEVHDDTV